MLTASLRFVADAVVVGLVLFAAAGTLAWSQAWVLLAALVVVRLSTAVAVFRVHPALLRERAFALFALGWIITGLALRENAFGKPASFWV